MVPASRLARQFAPRQGAGFRVLLAAGILKGGENETSRKDRRRYMSNRGIDRERWAKLDIREQMGNIGSEVGRAIKARRTGKEERVSGAIDRALDLFDATTEVLIQNKSHRVREVLRARDEFLRLFHDGTFETDADQIEKYFMRFALAARKEVTCEERMKREPRCRLPADANA
jgi:hypothetical protein